MRKQHSILALVLASAASAQSSYRLTDLGALPGSRHLVGVSDLGVNDLGQVAGTNNYRPFLSGPNGGALRDLGTLPGGGVALAYGVNALGQVTGESFASPGGGPFAFLSGPDGGALRNLGAMGGIKSVGNAVNASGQVTGYAEFGIGGYSIHGFLSAPNGGALRDLGINCTGYGVNDAGRVTGSWNGSAFLSGPDGGPLKSLGKLAGYTKNNCGLGVNASGQVAGYGMRQFVKMGFTITNYRAFLSEPDGGALKDLGALGKPTAAPTR